MQISPQTSYRENVKTGDWFRREQQRGVRRDANCSDRQIQLNLVRAKHFRFFTEPKLTRRCFHSVTICTLTGPSKEDSRL